MLLGDLDNDMKSIMRSIACNSDFEMEACESDADHIHFLIRNIPRLSVASIVRKLKQQSTIAIWKKYKSILSANFWKENTFWSDGYFVCLIGEASPETVRHYILSQG
jgi:putative transposase